LAGRWGGKEGGGLAGRRVRMAGRWGCSGRHLSSEHGTYRTVKARFWPRLSSTRHYDVEGVLSSLAALEANQG